MSFTHLGRGASTRETGGPVHREGGVSQPDGGSLEREWSAPAQRCAPRVRPRGHFRANEQIFWMLDGEMFRLGSEQPV
jgi:hypothetical protein